MKENEKQNGKEQSQTARQSKANPEILLAFLQQLRTRDYLLQAQHRQQRNGEFGYHKNGRHRTELVVHRHIIDEEVGESHQVLSP